MKKVSLIAALAALICGFAVYLYLNSVEERIARAEQEQAPEMTEIVVAARLIPPYTEVTADMLRLEQYPADYVSAQAIRSVDEVVGLRSEGAISEGQQLFPAMFSSGDGAGAALSFRVPEGMRAMTVPVTVSSGVGGYVVRGDLVDLLVWMQDIRSDSQNHHRETEPKSDTASRVLISGAMVLACGDVTVRENSGVLYANVTLALTPEECLKVFAALEEQEKNGGAIYLTLRHRGDGSATDGGIHTSAELLLN